MYKYAYGSDWRVKFLGCYPSASFRLRLLDNIPLSDWEKKHWIEPLPHSWGRMSGSQWILLPSDSVCSPRSSIGLVICILDYQPPHWHTNPKTEMAFGDKDSRSSETIRESFLVLVKALTPSVLQIVETTAGKEGGLLPCCNRTFR